MGDIFPHPRNIQPQIGMPLSPTLFDGARYELVSAFNNLERRVAALEENSKLPVLTPATEPVYQPPPVAAIEPVKAPPAPPTAAPATGPTPPAPPAGGSWSRSPGIPFIPPPGPAV